VWSGGIRVEVVSEAETAATVMMSTVSSAVVVVVASLRLCALFHDVNATAAGH